MTPVFAWIAFVTAIAVVGRMGWSGLAAVDEPLETPSGWRAIVLDSYWGLLSGLALLSVCLLALVHLGTFTAPALGAAVLALVATGVILCHRRGVLGLALRGMPRAVASGVILAALSLVLAALLPPFDTTLAGSDSSVYLGAAHHLARQGTLVHRDRVASEVSTEERTLLFANRFTGDGTGAFVRFPGGVPLLAPSRDYVTFSYSHLFPAWLATAMRVAGRASPLKLQALLMGTSLLSLFGIGHILGGTGLGLAACLLLGSFYPEIYFTRFPTSELLGQALFLSGLLALLRGIGDGRRSRLVLAGLLWGAFCLSRVDALPLLLLGLAPMSLLATRLGLRPRDWAIPLALTLLLGALAVGHQVANGSYLGPFRESPPAVAVRLALADHVLARVGLLLALGGVGLVAVAWSRRPRSRGRLIAALRAFAVVAAAVVIALFLSRVSASAIATHAAWLGLYAGRVLPLVLGVGLVVVTVQVARGHEPRAVAVALLLLALPGVCYLVDPFVVPQQPWAMRRFLPMIAPLFILLSLHGWRSGLDLVARRRAAGRVAFAGIAILSAVVLLGPSLGLVIGPGAVAVAPQIDALAAKMPPGALVVVPDTYAGLHLQIPLQFSCGRDVLLLPLAAASPALEEVAVRYLERQLDAGRRVVVFPGAPSDGDSLLRRFRLTLLFEAPLSWDRTPFARSRAFPRTPHTVILQTRAWELHRGGENGVSVAAAVRGLDGAGAVVPGGGGGDPRR